MTKIQEDIEKLKKLRAEVRLGGGKDKIELQHSKGKLTARERIELLFDKNTFKEIYTFARHQCRDFGMDKYRPYGDAVITGFGEINGRICYAYATDFTVMGGSYGKTTAEKICDVYRRAREVGVPVIALIDSVGARIQEGGEKVPQIFYENTLCSGVIPQITAIMGPCAGVSVYSPAITDFVIMVDKTATMHITGPRVIEVATGEKVSEQELGGADVHSRISGVADFVVKNDKECIELIRKLLSYLPSNWKEKPPRVETDDDPMRMDEKLNSIVPDDPKKPFDMYEIINRVVDKGSFLEVKKNFAPNIITGFARLNGETVGIVANQPKWLAGCLDINASEKAARFVRFCDCFNIPIITFSNSPGYLPGVDQEHQGIIRRGAKLLFAYSEATVPKITVLVRASYGGAAAAMANKWLGTDIVLAWPSAEMTVMGAKEAVSVLYYKEIQKIEDPNEKRKFIEEKAREFEEKFSNPYHLAERMAIDEIIIPSETRPWLIHCLKMLRNKDVKHPKGKHRNIPL